MAITVTAAESVATFNGVLIRVKVLIGTAAAPIGAIATQSGSGAKQQQITTTQTGSQVYGALLEVGSTAFTANAQTTLFDNTTDAVNGLTAASCRSTSATGTPGAEVIGASAPAAGGGGTSLLEILPSGTITEDASSPAGVYNASGSSAVTASFTPPAGALLVAMVAADASAATVVTVSDSSGLTWTQRVTTQSAGNSYTGIWTAQIPAAAAGGQRPVTDDKTHLKKLFYLLG